MQNPEVWQDLFEKKRKDDPFTPEPLTAMEVLQHSLRKDDSTTLQELVARLRGVREALCKSPTAGPSIKAGMELFTRFVTRAHFAIETAVTFEEVQEILVSRGEEFLKMNRPASQQACKGIPHLFMQHFSPVIITHSWNLCVYYGLVEAKQKGHNFKVLVTEGQPQSYGHKMAKELRNAGVKAEVILDAAVGFYMEQATFLLVGAEAICINGGMLAPIGTATITSLARHWGKKVYVLAESYRISFEEALNNRSLPLSTAYGPQVQEKPMDKSPLIDYTPPRNVCFIYTDVGEMHPSLAEECLAYLFT